MSSELGDAERCTLVRLYRARPILWDQSHCDFNNSKQRSKAIEQIVAEAQIPDLTKAKATLFFRNMRREFYAKLSQGLLTKTYLQTTKWQWLKIAHQFLTVDNQPRRPQTVVVQTDDREYEKNLDLVNYYKEEELLWNTQLPQYKVRAMREAAWNRIIAKLQIDGLKPDDVRIKIKNLRTAYHKHCRLVGMGNTVLGGEAKWMTVMDSFLRPILFGPEAGTATTNDNHLNFDDDEQNYRIMECYRQQPVLWNTSDPFSGNRTVMDEAWDACAKQMSDKDVMSRKDFQRLLRSLVARYTRKRGRIHSNDVAAFCPELKWFHLAESFLGPIMFQKDEDNNEDQSLMEEVIYEPESIESAGDEDAYETIFSSDEMLPELTENDSQMVSETVEISDEMLDPQNTQLTICRACFKYSANNTQLSDILREYIGFRSKDDEMRLPNTICGGCERIILNFRDFRTMCQSNEEEFLAKLQAEELENLEKELPDEEIIELDIRTNADYDLEEFNFEDDGSLVIEEYLVEPPDDGVSVEAAETVEEPARFVCSVCSKSYNREDHLQSHLKLIHNQTKSNDLNEKSGAQFSCTLCKSVFRKKMSLISHKKYVHNEQAKSKRSSVPKPTRTHTVCQICGERRTIRSIKVHLQSHRNDGERFQCRMCEKNYKMPDALRNHVRIKHLGKTYDCQYCDQKFTSWNGRSIHTHLKHYNPKAQWSCDCCDRMFPSEMTLRRHRRIIHMNAAKSFGCDQCRVVCATATILKAHKQAKHSGVQFKCQLCEKVFTSQRILRSHMVLVHTDERNYDCPVCHRRFKLNALVRAHVEKMHPGYQLPPKGTVLNVRALKRMAQQKELDDSLVKVDFEG